MKKSSASEKRLNNKSGKGLVIRQNYHQSDSHGTVLYKVRYWTQNGVNSLLKVIKLISRNF